MAPTLVLLVYPVSFVLAIIIIKMGYGLGPASLAIGLPLGALFGWVLLRFARGLDKVDRMPKQP